MEHHPHASRTSRGMRARAFKRRERGASLVELLVGIVVGLLVVLAALGTVVYTNTTAAAVTDTVRLNLQAQSVFETLARHLRQSASHTVVASIGPGVVTFQSGLAPGASAVSEINAGQFVVRHGTLLPSVVPAFAPSAVVSSCLGGLPGAGAFLSVNTFSTAGGALRCSEGGGGAQAIAENVEAFVTRYGVRNLANNNLQYVSRGAVVSWQDVEAVEVCLQLRGDRTNTPNLATYNNCQGVATPTADGRLHRVFRRIFTVRPEFRVG